MVDLEWLWAHKDWLAGAATLTGRWLAGNKNRWCWLISFVNQFVWLGIIWDSRLGPQPLWGLVPLSITMIFVDIRNFIVWSKDEGKEWAVKLCSKTPR